ncbi:MAG: FAD-dependent oxidoreductase [Candidatus Aenigmarchaeota archaeon]|nr:FAD-dependent oxidoreductase [Candidatus Aenigmarchaeota archaeon]
MPQKTKKKEVKPTKKVTKDSVYDIAIIGGGVVGFAAAMYAGRFRMKTILFGDKMGGVIVTTDVVENYPGFKHLTGQELADKVREHAMDYEVEMEEELVSNIEKNKDIFKITAESGRTVNAKTVLFATGTKWRKLGVPGEEQFANRGVHYCALCDGSFFKGKAIGLVGGSDSAAKDALVLTQYGKKVYIIYRGEQIHPEPVNMERVQQKIKEGKIEIINHTNVKEIKGDKFVKSVILDKPYKGKNEFPLDALFVAIGHIPLSDLAVKLGVKVDIKKEIIIDRTSSTNVPGVYAAGDVVDTKFKQAITGVGEAVSAVYSAYTYIGEQSSKRK